MKNDDSRPDAFTVGAKGAYDANLSTGERITKLGKTADYEGGWVWRTEADARAFLAPTDGMLVFEGRPPVLCDVYGLVLPNGWDTDVSSEPDTDGIHVLLTSSPLVRLPEQK